MEYVDVLTQDGVKTGLKKTKSDVHRDGDWHRAVHVWILNPHNQLLIQKRSSAKESHPDLWDISAAGHISAGEDSFTAAVRETEEELGLKLRREDLSRLFSITEEVVLNKGTYIDNEICDVYLVRNDVSVSDITMQPEEVEEIRFLDLQELKEKLTATPDRFVAHQKEYEKLFQYLESIAD